MPAEPGLAMRAQIAAVVEIGSATGVSPVVAHRAALVRLGEADRVAAAHVAVVLAGRPAWAHAEVLGAAEGGDGADSRCIQRSDL